MSITEYMQRFGGLVQQPSGMIRLNGTTSPEFSGDALHFGDLMAVEVWHWRWLSVWFNQRNKHLKGWAIVAKKSAGWKQHVLMVTLLPIAWGVPDEEVSEIKG